MPSPLDDVDLRRRVQHCLDDELATQAAVLAELGPDVDDLITAVVSSCRPALRPQRALPSSSDCNFRASRTMIATLSSSSSPTMIGATAGRCRNAV